MCSRARLCGTIAFDAIFIFSSSVSTALTTEFVSRELYEYSYYEGSGRKVGVLLNVVG